jgi:Rab-GTPase-TBC domain
MGSGCFIQRYKTIIFLNDQKPYKLTLLDKKVAGIGIYFIDNSNPAPTSDFYLKLQNISHEYFSTDPKIYKKLKRLMKKGPGQENRWSLWLLFLNTKIIEDYSSLPIQKNACEDVIRKDINRTFPNFLYFKKENYGHHGQDALYRVLGKFSTAYPSVGYCQGMNYIVGFLLMISGGNEEEVYSFFISLCEEFNLFDVFSEDMRELHKNLYVFNILFEETFPKLFNHFKSEEIMEDMWIFKWILSLFTSCLPLNIAVRLWDLMIILNNRGIFQISLGIISILEESLLKSDLSEILKTFEDLTDTKIPCKDFIRAALKIKIKKTKIQKLQRDFQYDQLFKTHPGELSPNTFDTKRSLSPENSIKQIYVQEIIETLDELPPFKTSKSGYATPYRPNDCANTSKLFEYYKMGRISFVEDKTPNEEDCVNPEQFLNELVNERVHGDSFIIQVYEDNKS